MKKWIASLLAAVMLLSLTSTALAAAPAFPDVTDAATQQEVDTLRMMGVISGDNYGNFNPTGTLTRAQFCKMIIEAMGRGEEEALYRTRTLFSDVLSTHWARGYINMAATMTIGGSDDGTSSVKLIRGMSDGTFQPDRAITYAEAVTILMRTLGYDDTSAGMLWPDGYLRLAGESGLTSGLSLNSGDSLTRAQAAHLFCNLLNTKTKSGTRYLDTLGTSKEDVLILALDVTNNGQSNAVRTSDGVYSMANGVMPESALGCRGTLVLNSKDQIVTFFPSSSEQTTLVVSKAQSTWVMDADGVFHAIPSDTTVYTATGTTTYGEIWSSLTTGTQLTQYLTAGGKLDSIYVDLTPIASEDLRVSQLVVSKAQSTWLMDAAGALHSIPADTTVYTATGTSTYGEIWSNLTAGTQITQFLTASGKVDSIYVDLTPTASEDLQISQLVVSKAQVSWLMDADGVFHSIPADTTVYTATGTSTYGEIWSSLTAGTQVTQFLTASGKLDSLYVDLTPTATGDLQLSQTVVSMAQSTWLLDTSGNRRAISADTTVYTDTETTTYGAIWSELSSGTPVTLFLTSSGKLEALYVSLDSTGGNLQTVTVVVSKAQATWLTGTDGIRRTIPANTVVYTTSESTTYDQVWVDLAPGTSVTLFLTASGTVESLYLDLTPATNAIVATSNTSERAFDAITGGARNLNCYRNNVAASLSEIRPYDVVTYDASSNTLRASSQRITGVYENASPNPEAPSTVTVMGQKFPVMASAADALASFKIGQEITLLLTQDGQVASVVSPNELRASVIGLVDEISSTSVKVTLLNGTEVTSVPSLDNNQEPSDFNGALVSLTSDGIGAVRLTKLTGRSQKDSFDIVHMKLGEYRVSSSVALYERAGNSSVVSISLSDLTMDQIPSGKISYVHRDSNDEVDIIVFRDVTGDRYAYGFFSVDEAQSSVDLGDGEFVDDTERTVTIRNSGNYNTVGTLYTNSSYRNGAAGGLVATKDGTVAASVYLTSLTGVSRYDFFTKDNIVYVTVNGVTYPVSSEVECYNKAAKVWFDSLTEARAFSDDLTLYYDRAPEEGGKIRLVVAN